MNDFLRLARALSDPNRARALVFLRGGELCLCQIAALLNLSFSTVSKHMDILRQAGLVAARKEGRWRYFKLAGRQAPPAARRALRWVLAALGDDPLCGRDAKKLKSILKQPAEKLCAAGRKKCCS